MRHSFALLVGGLLGAATTIDASLALAQEPERFQRGIAAPAHAFELRIGTSFTQGFGSIAPGQRVLDVAGPGLAADIDGAWRIDPFTSLGVELEYQEFTSERNTAARGLVGNVGFTLHASPHTHGDPWARLATGYRVLWSISPPGAPNTLLHGFELAKMTIGYDVRVSPDIALAPSVGADLDLFLWQVQGDINTAMTSGQLGTFVYAGVQGRFDMGGVQTGGPIANGW
jgi:hypothetical protein